MKTRNKMISLLLTVIFMFTIIPAVAVNAASNSYYTVSFDANGGSGTMDELTVFKDTIGDFSFEAPACGFTAPFAKEFAGWSLNGVVFRPGETIKISDNVTLKASWTDIQTYITVSFNPNGGSGTMPSIAVEVDEDGLGKFYFPECDFTPPEGKEFAGWYWADPVFETFQPGFLWWLDYDKYTTVVLKALWKDDEKYTIKFDPNGGSGTMPDIRILPSSSGNAELTLPECTFTPPAGKVFDQWAFGKPGDTVFVSGSATCKAFWKNAPVSLSITNQPINLSGAVGSTVTFRIGAEGEGLQYKWQYYYNGKWNNAASKISTYDVTIKNSLNGMKVRCIVTDKYGNTETSKVAVLTVTQPAKITKQPVNSKGLVGSTVTFSIGATGEGLQYKWQYYYNGKWNTAASKKAMYDVTVKNTLDGMKVRCIVSDKYGNTVTSKVVVLTVSQPAKITKQPVSCTGTAGSKVTFSIEAEGEGLQYKWQYYYNGKWNTAASKTSTYVVTAKTSLNGMKVRCIVTDEFGTTVTSKVVVLTVKQPPKITKQPENLTAQAGKSVTFSIEAEGDGLQYVWQYYYNGKWNTAASKTSTYKVTARTSLNGMKVRCIVTDQYGSSVTSQEAFLKVI